MSILQWSFLLLAIGAAIAEVHSVTIYLAGVAVAALLATLAGFWVKGGAEVAVFAAASLGVLAAVPPLRRKLARKRTPELDLGETVVFVAPGARPGEAVVRYRGAQWQADIDPAEAVVAGQAGVITARHGSRLVVKALAGAPKPEKT